MKILISTQPDDTHALLVKLALEAEGHQVVLFFTADQPSRQANSVFVDAAHYQWQSMNRWDALRENDYDVVWWRRARKPYLPKTMVHPQDYAFVMRENQLFHESLTHTLAPNAFWINSKESASRANFKLLQLKLASECGLKIPTTLCSNDPHEIRCFVLKYASDGVVYKPFCSHFWFEKDQYKALYTAKVGYETLPNVQSLQSTPGIFQKEVKKKYEVRIVCFGHWMVAVKLDSQAYAEGVVDWRKIRDEHFIPEPHDIPLALQMKLRQLMEKLGIVFGSFDLIVTQEDDYVFLEVNEQGQFLWIEDRAPSFLLLDMFVQFILNQSVSFVWDPTKAQHTIARYNESVKPILLENMQRHVDLNRSFFYQEQQGCVA